MDRPFHPDFILRVIPSLLAFLPVTLLIMGGTVVLGSFLGFFLARARLGKNPFWARLSLSYTVALRCTPSIVLLFLVYYGLPALALALFGVDINGIYKGIFVILTMTLLFAATMGEIMRSSYLAIDRGQREAAVSIGLSEAQAFRRIVLPQAAVVALPNFANSLITLMKEGALAYTIGMVDMMGQGNLIIARNYGNFTLETYLALALIYWVMTLVIENIFRRLEKALFRGRRGLAG
jgi:L-cystine transport system permease protein